MSVDKYRAAIFSVHDIDTQLHEANVFEQLGLPFFSVAVETFRKRPLAFVSGSPERVLFRVDATDIYLDSLFRNFGARADLWT